MSGCACNAVPAGLRFLATALASSGREALRLPLLPPGEELSGAASFAFTIQVSIDGGSGTLDQADKDLVLVHMGGVAALTLLVNATACPMTRS